MEILPLLWLSENSSLMTTDFCNQSTYYFVLNVAVLGS